MDNYLLKQEGWVGSKTDTTYFNGIFIYVYVQKQTYTKRKWTHLLTLPF